MSKVDEVGSPRVTSVRVAVIGAGFSGVGAAIALTNAGIHDYVVLEKAAEVGGTWRENTYPGCGCDVFSSLYSYSFAPNPNWSRAFARQPEILAYLRDVAERYGVTERVRFETVVRGATWSETTQTWTVETSTGIVEAQAVIAAAGPLHEPKIPDLPGLDTFAGTTFHSAEWNHDHDLTGRRVAVVGTGASAIQFVPEIVDRVASLTLFQRTAPWVLPKPDHPVPAIESGLFRRVPAAQRAFRSALYHGLELLQLGQRHPRVMAQIQRIGLANLRLQVRDPQLRAALTPEFTLGCKRILLSNTYYRALTRPHVDVVPRGVREVRERSVIDADGVEHEVDTIIFGTGFHVTDPPIASMVRGRDGRTLAEVWQGSPQAYLGTTVSGFPNAFITIGPNLGNGHSSAIVLVEAQLRYIVGALKAMDRDGIASIDVRKGVQSSYNSEVQAALAGTVWNAGGCSSYYLDANGRNSAIYPWSTIDLRRRTRRFTLAAYETRAVDAVVESLPAAVG
ncbi:flavin-containing monooxygenase [Pseudonocardia sp. GCM10023141]|uniref:flavin-containing monooxygenase n=1 Tax=Pseudonocardia sp. GCM10023141 TaxID=3252653 RepID=UPI00361584AC